MNPTRPEIQEFLEQLADTPRRLTVASANVDETRLRLKPDPSGWSALDNLAHLRACADVWGASIEAMLADDEPTLPDIHPRKWQKQVKYPKVFVESLQAFIVQRKKLLEALKPLQFEDWSRGAQIGGRRHTVFTQVRRMAKHEAQHCEQIETILMDWRIKHSKT
jgi:hypothetical protein